MHASDVGVLLFVWVWFGQKMGTILEESKVDFGQVWGWFRKHNCKVLHRR